MSRNFIDCVELDAGLVLPRGELILQRGFTEPYISTIYVPAFRYGGVHQKSLSTLIANDILFKRFTYLFAVAPRNGLWRYRKSATDCL